MTKLDLDKVAAATAEAYDGPWRAGRGGRTGEHPWEVVIRPDLPFVELDDTPKGRATAKFMAASRTWVPQLVAAVQERQARIAAALAACDRMMAGQLSPSGIVAEVREALGWQPPPLPARPFIGCRLPCGPGLWCGLNICHDGGCKGVPVESLPPSADDPEQETKP